MFYDGNKLLSLRTLTGGRPEIYFCVGNRMAGKSFYFKRLCMRRFAKYHEKFAIFVREVNDVKGRAESFWADLGPICFPGGRLRQKKLLEGKAARLEYQARDGEPWQACGYVICIKYVRPIKENSAMFADVERIFFDEFQDEDRKYLPNEIEKFNSVRMSIGRGGTKATHTRYVPCYLCCNAITLFNPYYDYWRIAPRLEQKAKYVRGSCWVLEQCYNEDAAAAVRETYAGASQRELDYAAGNRWLLDNNKYVTQIKGQKFPVLNFVHNGDLFGLWRQGKTYYCTTKISDGIPFSISFTMDDHDEGNIMIPANAPLIKSLRNMYLHNLIYFENGKCKNAFLDICTLIR